VALDRLLEQAGSHPVAGVRAALAERLHRLAEGLESRPAASADERLAAADIRRWERRTLPSPDAPPVPVAPPGSPIGG